jgi:hypothetical protein
MVGEGESWFSDQIYALVGLRFHVTFHNHVHIQIHILIYVHDYVHVHVCVHVHIVSVSTSTLLLKIWKTAADFYTATVKTSRKKNIYSVKPAADFNSGTIKNLL